MLARTSAALCLACAAGIPLLVACTAMSDAAAGVGNKNTADLAAGGGQDPNDGSKGTSGGPVKKTSPPSTSAPQSTASSTTTQPAPLLPPPDPNVCAAKGDVDSCGECCYGGENYPAEAKADVPWFKCACDIVKTSCAGNTKCINAFCSPSDEDETTLDDCPCATIDSCDSVYDAACAADATCTAASNCSDTAGCNDLPESE